MQTAPDRGWLAERLTVRRPVTWAAVWAVYAVVLNAAAAVLASAWYEPPVRPLTVQFESDGSAPVGVDYSDATVAVVHLLGDGGQAVGPLTVLYEVDRQLQPPAQFRGDAPAFPLPVLLPATAPGLTPPSVTVTVRAVTGATLGERRYVTVRGVEVAARQPGNVAAVRRGPHQPEPDARPIGRLPGGTDWSAGDLLVLVAPPAEQKQAFEEQVAAIEKNTAGLVGGGVFVIGRSRLWKWGEWVGNDQAAQDGNGGTESSLSDTFTWTFLTVAADRQAVAAQRPAAAPPLKTVVVWHSAFCPPELPAELTKIGQMPNTTILWSGKQQAEQRDDVVLPLLFGREGVYRLGPSVQDIASSTKDLAPKR